MTFEENLDLRLKLLREILGNEVTEYATEENRYHNFDKAAKIQDITPEQALCGIMTKHFVSVLDIIDGVSNDYLYTVTYIEEKIGDTIKYLIILESMIKDRRLPLLSSWKDWSEVEEEIEE